MKIIFIPAAGVRIDKLGRESLKRCVVGLKLWNTGRYEKILVTGGVFQAPLTQRYPAATIMKTWLTKHGVDPHRIIEETKSVDTFENVELGFGLLPKGNKLEITAVSNWQHCLRIWVISRHGYETNIKIYPIWSWRPWKEFLKEWTKLFYSLLDPKGKSWFIENRRKKREKQIHAQL